MTRWAIVILAVLVLPTVALAGTTGKITGTVIEKGGETIPGANIVVEGIPSVIGTTTDSKGTYVMLNIPAGTYSLKCTFIGYHSITVKNVQVTPDLTTNVDFELTPETLQAEAIVVIAERPLVQRDQTGSMRFTDAEELAVMPIRGYAAVTALQAGVTDNDGYLYVRGGRLEEVAYFVDGVSQQDLQTGRATTSINSNAIDQVVVTVGGFDAEYGRVMSGIVNVVTKEGGRVYNGSVEGITDELSGDWIDTPSFGHNNIDGALGGPVIPGGDKVSFFVSGELRDRKDRLPRAAVTAMDFERNLLSAEEFKLLSEGLLPHHKMDGSSWQGKFTFRISDRINLKAGFLGSTQDEEQYRHHYRYNLRHSPVVDRFNNSVFAKLTYTVNPKTFLTVESNGFVNRYIRADGVHGDNLNEYGRPSGNPRFDPETLFYLADLDSTAQSRDSDGFITGDEGHVWDDYIKRRSFYITPLDIDLTSQVTPNHQVKAGFDIQLHKLRYYRHLFPVLTYRGAFNGTDDPGGFQDVDRYGYDYNYNSKTFENRNEGRNDTKEPILAAVYLQDKIEFEGLVVNLGVRYDYLDARTKVLRDESVPLGGDSKLDDSDLAGNSIYHKFSPRIGVGFPITDKTVFHIHYGIFYQQPNLEDLYVGEDYLQFKAPLGGYYYAFGNPNLKPEQTTAYEVGLVHQLGDHGSLDVTTYYKAVKNLVEVTTVPSNPAAFSSFRNRDFGTIKGVDISAKMRRTGRLMASVSYSLSYSSGTGSNPETQRNIAWGFQPGVTEPPKITAPLNFDQRHSVSANLDYRFASSDGPQLMGGYPLSNAGVNVLLKAGSGFPYTPTTVYNAVTLANVAQQPTGSINSSYGPWNFQIDAKANKAFQFGRINGNLYVWAINLLDRKNLSSRSDREGRGIESTVYAGTGSAETTGWLNTSPGRDFVSRFGDIGRQKFELKEQDPQNFATPRQVRFGLALNF